MSKIRVKIAPGRDEADRLIAALHTSNPRRPWTARQAAFFQVDAGRSYRELVERYPTIRVHDFVYRARMVNLFRRSLGQRT